MLKICLCSDNHGDMDSIYKILSDNPACDYYFHCGDSLVPPEMMEPFISVAGNNDYIYEYPKQRIVEISRHRILIMHGHHYCYSMNEMYEKARNENVDTVFYGHTHVFADKIYNGLRFINPGSSFHNRDFTAPCYARVYILDDNSIRVERIDL